MCGLVGFITSRGSIERNVLIRLRDTLIHRGPDSGGVWINKEENIGLAHRRLSIIDLSHNANQPMSNEDGTILLVFNGEIYNFGTLRQDLINQGHSFRSCCDAEVLIHLYEEYGYGCLNKLKGMFAFALYDTKKKKMFIARDKAGEKPLYYYISNSTFICASELKAIVQYPGFKKEINYTALTDYLVYGYIPAPKSIWSKTYKLRPGHFMVVDSKTLECTMRQYWDIDFTTNFNITRKEAIYTIRELLRESVKTKLLADVPLGVLLSGGVDSSAVVAFASRYVTKINTFTMGFDEKEWDERLYARNIAKRYNTSHNEKTIKASNVNEVFDSLLWFYDEPFNDYSNIPTYYVCSSAAKFVKVCLTGDGGDELFCGYSKYQRFHVFNNLFKYVPIHVREKIFSKLALYLSGDSKLKKQILRLGLSTNELIFDLVSTSIKSSLDKVLLPDVYNKMREYNPISVINCYLKDDKVKHWDLINQARYIDFKVWLADMMLVKTDRASMANSLELRAPILDDKFVEFIATLPANFLVSHSCGKKIFKKSLEKMLPRENLYRKKMGLVVPLEKWYKSELKDRVKSIYESRTKFINKDYLKSLYECHVNTKFNFAPQLNNLVTLEAWAQKWL